MTFRNLLILVLSIAVAGCSVFPFGEGSQFGGGVFSSPYKDGYDPGLKALYTDTSGSYWLSQKHSMYHTYFDVFTDFGSGGNHFVVKAVMGDTNISFREDFTNSPYAGDTAIEVIYTPRSFTDGSFINGTTADGVSPDIWVVTPMAQAIPLLALRDLSNFYTNAMKTTESNNRQVSNASATLYDYNTDKDGMYTEGNGWMAMAYLFTNAYKTNTPAITAKATNIQHGMTNTNRGLFGSLYASTKDKLTTGYIDYNNSNWVIYRRPAVAPTALNVLLGRKKNPFWLGTAYSNLVGPLESAPKSYIFLTNQMDTNHFSFYIYKDGNNAGNRFNARALMYSTYGDRPLVTVDEQYTNQKKYGRTAARYYITNTNINLTYYTAWVGMSYQLGVLINNGLVFNWGNFTNAGLNLTGATTLSFWARGKVGGEKIEFGCLGVGRALGGGTNINVADGYQPFRYPDSGWMTNTNITLTTTWKRYTINLTGKNLSYVLGGFNWGVTVSNTNAVEFYLDDICINVVTTNKPHPIASYLMTNNADTFDNVLMNYASSYDNALAAMAFISYGDQARAKRVLDFYVDASTNDRYYTDGRIRNGYMAVDKYLPGGWNMSSGAKTNAPALPGWWDPTVQQWFEDTYAVGTSTEVMAYMMLAMLACYNVYGGQAYLDTAVRLGDWVENNCRDTRGAGGYKGGKFGWAEGGGQQTEVMSKTVAINSALYAAFSRLNTILGGSWGTRASWARSFVLSMYGTGWSGVYYMNGQLVSGTNQSFATTNWGYTPNAGFNLNYTYGIDFYAKGAAGGEQVKFFAGGIGSTNTGFTTNQAPYPDSFYVSTNFTLTTTWTKYTLDVSGQNLSNVIGGFGYTITTPASTNQVKFYVDDIKYKYYGRSTQPHFIVSFLADQRNSTNISKNSDRTLKNAAFIYDQSLAILAFLAVENTAEAQNIADALVYARTNDRYYTDGRMRNAYSSGDLISWPGWKPLGKTGVVRTPGWWDYADNKYYEDKYAMSTSTGNLAWVMIALLAYYSKAGGQIYLDTAASLGDWIRANAYSSSGVYPGYTGGTDGWEPTPFVNTWRSTEHNLDLYAAYTRLYQITGTAKWAQYATNAFTFVTNMFDPASNCFYMGTAPMGNLINKDVVPVDTQVWTHLSLLRLTNAYTNSFLYAETYHMIYTNVSSQTNWGFDFETNKDGIWYEGTGMMECGYRLKGQYVKMTNAYNARYYTGTLSSPEYGAVYAASVDGLSTGLQVTEGIMWEYFRRAAVAPTAWGVFADTRKNPFWIGSDYESLNYFYPPWKSPDYAYSSPNGYELAINDMFVYNNMLYTSHFQGASTYKWNGVNMTNAADNVPGSSTARKYFVFDMDGTGDALYIFSFRNAYGGLSWLSKLSGSTWTKITNVPPAPAPDSEKTVSNYIGEPVIFGTNLYISTCAYVSNSYTNPAAIWKFTKGSGWTRVFSNANVLKSYLAGDVYNQIYAYKMLVYNDGNGDRLYAFAMTNSGSYYYTIQWVYNGSTWSAGSNVNSTTVQDYSYIQSLAVYNSKPYIGLFKQGVYVLNNGSWSKAFTFQWHAYWGPWFDCEPAAMTVWNSKLYVGYNGVRCDENNSQWPVAYLYSHSGSDPFTSWNLERAYSNLVPVYCQKVRVLNMGVYSNNLYLGVNISNNYYWEVWKLTN